MNSPENIRTGLSTDEISRHSATTSVAGWAGLKPPRRNTISMSRSPSPSVTAFSSAVSRAWKTTAARTRGAWLISPRSILPGPHLANNLLNLGITEAAREAMRRLGYDLDEILAQEEEPGLGNGGLGRLASCYMDSLASVEVPAIGYGIRYEFGIFDQAIRDGWQ